VYARVIQPAKSSYATPDSHRLTFILPHKLPHPFVRSRQSTISRIHPRGQVIQQSVAGGWTFSDARSLKDPYLSVNPLILFLNLAAYQSGHAGKIG
jgi:hypothetical protein